MGTFGRDTLAVCFLNILSYCPRPPFFKVGSMGATSLGYPTFFALKLFGNLLGPKILQPISCFQESRLPNGRHPICKPLDMFHGKEPMTQLVKFRVKSDILVSHNKNPLKIMGIPSYGKPGLPRSHGPWGI